MGLGNIISQAIIEKRTLNDLDWARITRFAAFGYLFSVGNMFSAGSPSICLLQGPFLRYWYYGLDKFFAGAAYKPVKMMLVDQVSR